MSIFGNIQVLNSALRSFTYAQNVVALNIANATTPGYSRQVALLQPSAATWDGTASVGSGVGLAGIQRLRNTFLDNQLYGQLSLLGQQSARNSSLAQLALVFPETSNPAAVSGISGAMSDVVSSWQTLAASPASAAAKAGVQSSLQALAQRFNLASQQLFATQRNIDTQVAAAVDQVNGYLDQILQLNKAIQGAPGVLGSTSPLMDQREQAVEGLVKLSGATINYSADGSVVATFNGGTLVDGKHAYHLGTLSSSLQKGWLGVGYESVAGSSSMREVTTLFGGGTLGGLLQTRNVDLQNSRLALDKMAFGVIQRANLINRGFVASDGTYNHDLFTGTKASDMAVDPAVQSNAAYVGGTRDSAAPGDLATMQATLNTFDMYTDVQNSPGSTLATGAINPDGALSSQPFVNGVNPLLTALSPGRLVIATAGNAVQVTYNASQSLNQVIRAINTAAGGAFYATLEQTGAGKYNIHIISSAPLTVYDDTNFNSKSNLGRALMLSTVTTSSTAVNNSVTASLNPVDDYQALSSSSNTQNLYTKGSTGSGLTGQASVNGYSFNWTLGQSISSDVLPNLGFAPPASQAITAFFSPATQTVTLVRTGDPLYNNSTLKPGNPMGPIVVSDLKGNLTRVLNLDFATNSTKIFSQLTTGLSSSAGQASLLQAQAQSMVDATQALQSLESSVDLNAEMAQAAQYQRAYQAAVRMQYVLDDMLNVLINRMSSGNDNSVI